MYSNLPNANLPKVPDFQFNATITGPQNNRPDPEKVNQVSIQYLQHLAKECKEVIAISRQLSQMKKTDPQDVLDYVKRLPDYKKHPMNVEERHLFIEVEEALNHPDIIPAKEFELTQFQLGILWKEYNENNLSHALFYNLIASRIGDIQWEKIINKKAFIKFEDIGGALYERDRAQMCALIHNTLMNGEDRKAYTIALETFHKRIQGIKNEKIEKSFYKLIDKDRFEPQASNDLIQSLTKDSTITCVSPPFLDEPYHPTDRQREELDVKQISLSMEKVAIERFPGPSFSKDPVNRKQKIKYYALREPTMKWMALFLPEDKKGLLSTDVSIDDLLKNELKENNLFKIMLESLSQKRLQEKSLIQINKMTNAFLKNNLNEQTYFFEENKFEPMEMITTIKSMVDACHQEFDRDEPDPLNNFKLITNYANRLNNFVSEKINQKIKENKSNLFEKTISKKSRLRTEELKNELGLFYRDIRYLTSFCLETVKGTPIKGNFLIYIYKKHLDKELSDSSDSDDEW